MLKKVGEDNVYILSIYVHTNTLAKKMGIIFVQKTANVEFR